MIDQTKGENMRKILFCALLSSACSMALMAESYVVDSSHSSVGFSVKHLNVSNVQGSFSRFSGSVEVEGKKIKALQGELDIASIDTNTSARDKHLRAPDFFDSKKFPKATLTLVKHKGKKLEAEITMRGISKNVVFDVELNGPVKHPTTGKDLIALTLVGKVNRKDFDIGVDTSNMMVSDNVDVRIELEASQQ